MIDRQTKHFIKEIANLSQIVDLRLTNKATLSIIKHNEQRKWLFPS